MKKVILMLLVLFTIVAKAQIADSIKLCPIGISVSYELSQFCWPNADESEQRENGTLVLEIGEGVSHSYVLEEQAKLERQLATFKEKNRWKIEMNLHALLGETYMRYPAKGSLTQIVDLDAAGVYSYTETYPQMNWKLGSQKKEVLGYTCQNATCSFRGRDYEAWFAPDIPLGYGPWKFHGLPGLILEIADTKNCYHITAKGIEKKKGQASIMMYGGKLRSIKRTRALKMEAMLHKDHGAYAADYGVVFRLGNGMEHSPFPYYPIELK